MPLRKFEVRLYASAPVTSATRYRVLLAGQVASCRWRITRKDGYADGELKVNGTRAQTSGLVAGRVVEFWGRDSMGVMIRLYRGEIRYMTEERKSPGKRSGKSITQTVCTLVGPWARYSRRVTRQRYAQPDGVDIGVLFGRFANKWIKGSSPAVVVDGGLINQNLTALDAWKRYFGDVASDMVDATGGFAVCGADVDPSTGADRVYLRPFQSIASAITIPLPDPGRRVLSYDTEQDATGIYNVLDLTGGADRFPNLLAQATKGNTSFEYPTYITAETYGELLKDGGFEEASYTSGTTYADVSLTDLTFYSDPSGAQTWVTSPSGAFNNYYWVGSKLTITSQNAGSGAWTTGVYIIKFLAITKGVTYFVVALDRSAATSGTTRTANATIEGLGTWNLSNGASLVTGGGSYGDTDGGNRMVLLPTASPASTVRKPFGPDSSKIIVGKKYRLRVRLRLENGAGAGNKARLRIRWLDSGGVPVGSDSDATFDNTSGLVSAGDFQTFTVDSVCPATATQGSVYVIFDTKPGGTTGGILVDNMSFTSAVDIVQPGWDIYPTGSASLTEVDWAYEGSSADAPVHGAYSVRIKCVSNDADNNDVSFRAKDNTKIGVTPGQIIFWKIWVKNPATEVAASINRPKIQMQLFEYDTDGNFVGSPTKVDYAATSFAGWTQLICSRTISAGGRSVSVSAVIRGNGSVLFDAAEVRDSGAGVTAAATNAGYRFVEDTAFEQVLSTTQVFDSGRPEAASIGTWGEITDIVEETSITKVEDSVPYAVSRLARTALPLDRPPVEIVGTAYPFFPGVYLRAVGSDAARILPTPLPIIEVEGEYDDRAILRLRPITNKENASEARITREIIRREIIKDGKQSFTGSPNTGSASSLTFGGSSGGGSGTVTSVAMTVPSFLTVAGTPITSSGTLAIDLASANGYDVLRVPTGSAAPPSMGALTSGHIPALDFSKITTGNVPVARLTDLSPSPAGSFGGAAKTLTATVNAKGLVTAIAEQAITVNTIALTTITNPDSPPIGADSRNDEFNVSGIDAKWTFANWTGTSSGQTFSYDVNTSFAGRLFAQAVNTTSQSGAFLRALMQALPTGDCTVVCKVQQNFSGSFNSIGLILANSLTVGSSSTKVKTWGQWTQTGTSQYRAYNWTGYDTYVSDGETASVNSNTTYYLRLVRVSGAWTGTTSTDGQTWINSTALSMPGAWTPTHIGLFVNFGTSSGTNSVQYDFFRVFSGVVTSIGTITSGGEINMETPVGTVNGSNTVFTLANTPITGSVRVFIANAGTLGGQSVSQRVLPTQFSVSGSTITFGTAPTSGSTIFVDYRF